MKGEDANEQQDIYESRGSRGGNGCVGAVCLQGDTQAEQGADKDRVHHDLRQDRQTVFLRTLLRNTKGE